MRAASRARWPSRWRSARSRRRARTGAASCVRHLDLPPGADFTPLFEGLPGDLCQCPHWGYVARGLDHRPLRRRHRGDQPGRRPLLLARRPHRLDRRGRDLPRVQPGRRDLRPVLEHLGAQLAPRPEPDAWSPVASLARSDVRARWSERRIRSSAARPRLAGRARLAGAPSTPPAPSRSTTPADEADRARPAGRGGVVARPARRLHRGPRARLPRLRRGSATSAGPGSARCGSASTTAIEARPAIAGGWLRRARRALDDDPECVEHGALLLREAEAAHGAGDLERAADAGRPQALDLGRRAAVAPTSRPRRCRPSAASSSTRATSPRAWATSTRRCSSRSRAASARTRPARCTAASSAPARSSATSTGPPSGPRPRCAGRSSHPFAIFPGICRVHRAVVLKRRGSLAEAEREAARACDELRRQPPGQRRGGLRRGRRHPPPARRPRPGRGGVRPGRGAVRPARAAGSRCCASRRAGSTPP